MTPETVGDVVRNLLPWWAHLLSVLLSGLVVPLAALALRNARNLGRIVNGGSGLLDTIMRNISDLNRTSGEIKGHLVDLDARVTRVHEGLHDLRREELTALKVDMAGLKGEVQHQADRFAETRRLVESLLIRTLGVPPKKERDA